MVGACLNIESLSVEHQTGHEVRESLLAKDHLHLRMRRGDARELRPARLPAEARDQLVVQIFGVGFGGVVIVDVDVIATKAVG